MKRTSLARRCRPSPLIFLFFSWSKLGAPMEAGRRTQDAGQSVSSPVALMALRGLRRKSPNVDFCCARGTRPYHSNNHSRAGRCFQSASRLFINNGCFFKTDSVIQIGLLQIVHVHVTPVIRKLTLVIFKSDFRTVHSSLVVMRFRCRIHGTQQKNANSLP